MAENELGTWFRSIPIVTRWWFSLSIVFPLLGRVRLINGIYMILDYASVIYRFQVRINDSKKQLQLRKALCERWTRKVRSRFCTEMHTRIQLQYERIECLTEKKNN